MDELLSMESFSLEKVLEECLDSWLWLDNLTWENNQLEVLENNIQWINDQPILHGSLVMSPWVTSPNH